MHEAINAPDTEDWTAAMDAEVNNTRRPNVSKEVLRPADKNIIPPRWVFRRKFESDTLIKYRTHLVARGLTQLPDVDDRESYLYVPVVRFESRCSLISIAALFDLDLRQFDVFATHLHGRIDGRRVYMESLPDTRKTGLSGSSRKVSTD